MPAPSSSPARSAAARRIVTPLRLDGDGAAARHLDQLRRARVRAPRPPHHAARHARPQGLQRRHLSHAPGRRQRRHGARRGEGHRDADAEAVRGLPRARPAGADVHQQARSAVEGSLRADGRDRARAGHLGRAHELAARRRAGLPRRVRPGRTRRAALRAPARRPAQRARRRHRRS